MSIARLSLYGNPNIGAFTFATDSFSLVPPDTPEGTIEEVSASLGVPAYKATVSGSVLLGIFAIGNSRGMILPSTATENEVEAISSLTGVPVAVYEGRVNALGNMVLVNDRAALVGRGTDKGLVELIRSHLGVDVYEGTIGGIRMTGVCAVVNSKGVVAHPMTSEAEIALLSKIFNTPVDVSTVNCGFPYLRVGITANSYGAVVGLDTTGPEMARIESSLGLTG
ncbi:MAG: translation initiation factor IF-6 [Candidatus Verstraetearchaeota archaeon]|nr:translation initiation factor IF-6 [Candidatus Verstraetearchaeota archaeon]